MVGLALGTEVGLAVGLLEGTPVGSIVGSVLGERVGLVLGTEVGPGVGSAVGLKERQHKVNMIRDKNKKSFSVYFFSNRKDFLMIF